MTRIKTPIKGISTTSTYEDGECYSLVNLRPKNGALIPVAPRKIIHELSQEYEMIFVHQNSGYENWIGVKRESHLDDFNYGIYYDILSNSPQKMNVLTGNSIKLKINQIEQIGNTLSFITDDSIYYALYKDKKYIFLGELPSTIIHFGETMDYDMVTPLIYSSKKYFKDVYGDNYAPGDNDTYKEATKGLVNLCMDEINKQEYDSTRNVGFKFFDAHYVRYALRLYDGTIVKHSPPILVMPGRDIFSMKTIHYKFVDSHLANESYVEVFGYTVDMKYSFEGIDTELWKDIIQSVDIFVSPPLGISSIENMKDLYIYPGSNEVTENLITTINKDVLKNIKDNSLFYLIRSLYFGYPGDTDKLPSEKCYISNLDQLSQQEEMTDDNFSNNKYGASVSYTYNNRLHLANIKNTLFNGFHPSYFEWSRSYNGESSTDGRYSVDSVIIEIEIQVGNNIEKTYVKKVPTEFGKTQVDSFIATPFISYPDRRAKQITIYEVENGVWKKVYTQKLTSHNFLNLSYYLNDKFELIRSSNPTEVSEIDTSKEVVFYESNKIKVSELNNPLYFPNENTYLTGNGDILALATNAIRISEGQFGQYPLYVFTSQGIYSLNIGDGEAVYSNQSAPTSYETPVSKVVCPTPFGVAFVTQRGLCMIMGQNIEFLTSDLQQTQKELHFQEHEDLKKSLIDFPQISFPEYLRNSENIIYNSYENEIIISNSKYEFNYVLNITEKSFYQSTEKIKSVVGNVFPKLFVTESKKADDFNLAAFYIKDYSESRDEDNISMSGKALVHVSFITRPLLYGTPDLKRLERMILRGTFFDVKTDYNYYTLPAYIVNYCSIDEIHFNILRGIFISGEWEKQEDGSLSQKTYSNRKDLDMGLFSRSKYRQFIVSFSGLIDESSIIQHLETEIDREYYNTKMR